MDLSPTTLHLATLLIPFLNTLSFVHHPIPPTPRISLIPRISLTPHIPFIPHSSHCHSRSQSPPFTHPNTRVARKSTPHTHHGFLQALILEHLLRPIPHIIIRWFSPQVQTLELMPKVISLIPWLWQLTLALILQFIPYPLIPRL